MPSLTTRARSRRSLAGLTVVAALVLSSCGGDDDSDDADDPASEDASSAEHASEGDDASESTEPDDDTTTTLDTTTTVEDDDDTTTTVEDDADDEGDDDTTSTTAPNDGNDEDDDDEDDGNGVDEREDAALALIARGLYSVPGAGTHCEIEPDGAFGRYAFPAAGGDVYALCIVLAGSIDEPLGPAAVRLATPDGTVVVDVEITEAPEASDEPVGGRAAVPLELRYESGRRILHGARIRIGDTETEISVPVFLPHDRPAGDWSVTYDIGGGQTGVLPVDRPCATSDGAALPDPIDIDPDLAFTREGPVTFPHCRALPDVVGGSLADAQATIDAWSANLGSTVDYSIDRTCGAESVVTETNPPAGQVSTFAVGAPNRFVTITEQIVCPDVPDLLATDYDEAVIVLDDLVARFPGFSWTAVANCRPGTVVTVQDPSPAPGAVTATVELNNCT